MLYLSVKYELLPNKCTHFTILLEIQNVNFFQTAPFFAWHQNFNYKILFHSYSTMCATITNFVLHEQVTTIQLQRDLSSLWGKFVGEFHLIWFQYKCILKSRLSCNILM